MDIYKRCSEQETIRPPKGHRYHHLRYQLNDDTIFNMMELTAVQWTVLNIAELKSSCAKLCTFSMRTCRGLAQRPY